MDIAKQAVPAQTAQDTFPSTYAPSPGVTRRPVTVAATPEMFDALVGWGVVVLTLFAAAGVLLGSWNQVSRPKDLLPLMIVGPAR